MTSPAEAMTSPAATTARPTVTEVWRTLTVRRFSYAVLLMAGLTATFALLSLAESAYFGRSNAVDSAFGSAMQFTGLPHFIIGFLFMASSRKTQNARSRIQILIGLAIGAGLCWLYYRAGGPDVRPAIPMGFVLIYFLVHEMRDEFFFYRRYGEAGDDEPYAGRQVSGLLLSLVPFALAVAWSVQFAFPEGRDLVLIPGASELPAARMALAWGLPVAVLLALSVWGVAKVVKSSGLTIGGLLGRDRPIWVVYAGILLVVAATGTMGGKSYSIVLLHVSAWWVFATVGLRAFGKKAGVRDLGVTRWLRTTQAGFQTLHVGLTILCVATAFVWAYRFGMAEGHILSWFGDRDAFYYWTIMHVTVSFVPKPA